MLPDFLLTRLRSRKVFEFSELMTINMVGVREQGKVFITKGEIKKEKQVYVPKMHIPPSPPQRSISDHSLRIPAIRLISEFSQARLN